jgi:hypothetical protein
MDGAWLAHWVGPAYVATALALLTGAVLIVLELRSGRRVTDDLVLNAWMWMNALWLVSDLADRPELKTAAMAVGGVTAALLAADVATASSRGVPMSRVRRLRVVPERRRPLD